MKNVILNTEILDLSGNVVVTPSNQVQRDAMGRVVVDAQGQPIRMNAAVTFGSLVMAALVRSTTKTNAETDSKFAFAAALNANLTADPGTAMQVGEGDGTLSDVSVYAFISNVMSRQPLIIKARFNQMIAAENPVVVTAPSV